MTQRRQETGSVTLDLFGLREGGGGGGGHVTQQHVTTSTGCVDQVGGRCRNAQQLVSAVH